MSMSPKLPSRLKIAALNVSISITLGGLVGCGGSSDNNTVVTSSPPLVTASADDTASKTMGARAIKTKQVIVSNNSPLDPQVLFRAKYTESGIHSMAVFPLMVSDEPVGVFALYASEIDFFHGEELKLLTELTGDIAFAIDHLEKQERLTYLAYYDALTGLANQNLFLERVAQSARSVVSGEQKLALVLLDLERFRNINLFSSVSP